MPTTPAQYTWMLPKTVISATVVYTITECSDERGQWSISPTVTVAGAIEPDFDIGPDYPAGLISVRPEDLKSFWQDRNVTVKTFANSHILNALGSSPVNQAGQIIGNYVSGATKLTAIALGVPAVAAANAPAPKVCGPVKDVLAQVKAHQLKLVDPHVTPDELKNLPGIIASLQTALSISVKQKIDPGAKPARVSDRTGRAFVGELKPTVAQLKDSGWFASPAIAEIAYNRNPALRVQLYMDFPPDSPAVTCSETFTRCSFKRVKVGKGTLFREVAYIPVLAIQASAPDKVVDRKLLPFGQFGKPRDLPLSASMFENMSWSLTFLESGELTDATFTSKATGLAASSFFTSLAGSANAIATEVRAAAVAVDPATTKLQNENAALKAQIDNINLTQQLHGLLAANR